ncbi:DNA (cytosine-5-)-methyltransferase [Tenacibaculum sp. 190524A05c]|uniref:DNA cytosine methyltransferase n=1 Tax=Tenacibaculum platacis TaxID=3137852 RepID=UPI0031FB4EBA
MKILNLYACIGGNRKLWGDEHEVTAVEIDPILASFYQKLFPNDEVIVGDAHEFLLKHYKEFDFIWGSPPCPTHSRARFWGLGNGTVAPVYPDMKLYQEILFLKHHFKGKWIIENVIPYYTPLIHEYKKVGRHLIWSNFLIGNFETKKFEKDNYKKMAEEYGYDLSELKYPRKDRLLRNLVHPEYGKYILDCSMNIIRKENINQVDLFDLIKNV